MRRRRPSTRDQLWAIKTQLNRMENEMTSGQAQIDADVASLQASQASIAASVQALVAEIANLQSQGVDTSALDAIAAQLASDAGTDAGDVTPPPSA